ncbi:prolyl oligopeptidase family serine peptidase [Streptomyces sp. NPDC059679]|uniref:S9 family peptidase n=1 Tax=Streptomyces sp. NPDC059679 TaxID=3346903 RepID=UPI00369F0703
MDTSAIPVDGRAARPAEGPPHLGGAEAHRFRTAEQVALSPRGDRVAIVVRWADTARDRWTTALVVRDTAEGAKEPEAVVPAGADAPAWSPDGRWLAHLVREPGQPGVSLALWSAVDRTVRPLARGLRAAGRPMWSPDGTRVAFVAAEEDGGEAPGRAPHVVRDLGYKIDGVGLVPKARRHLHIADIATGDVRQLTRGGFDVHGPAWSPDGAVLSLGVSRPAGDVPWPLADVCLADAATGELRHLVDWGGTVVWTGWTPERQIVFAGQRHPGPCQHSSLYRVVDGPHGEPVDLLAGFGRRLVASARGTTPAALFLGTGDFLFCAREAGGTRVYRAPAGGGRATPWFGGDSTVVMGMSASAAADSLALVIGDARTPGDVYLTPTDEPGPRKLTELNPWAARFTVTAAEDIRFSPPGRPELHGYLLRGRPAGTRGPTLFDIHSGPDYVWRPSLSPRHLYHRALAARGWNVLLLNPRGSDGYGEAFMRAPLGRPGFSEEEDFLFALDRMVRDGLASEGQVAVMGSSHGGFMTNWLTARTDRFAAGISVAGVANWSSLYGTSSLGATTAPVLLGGTPQDAPERYAASSPLTYVRDVTAPTLLLHGEDDLMNPIGQSEEWFTALRTQGCEVEFVRYPGSGHLFMHNGPLGHQEDYRRRVVAWLVEHVEGRDLK